jgi:predicted DNA-binding transcriptional regulator YafY
MRRGDRLFALIQVLRGGRVHTAESIAQTLEVSARTVYRDIADLQANQVPIDGERGIGFILREGYFLPPLHLTPLEHEALAWGVSFVASLGDEALSSAAKVLQSKLSSAAKVPTRVGNAPLVFSQSVDKTNPKTLQIAREALAQHRVLAIEYCDKDERRSRRTVRPLSLEFWGHVWTLTGWCEKRDDFRVFRLDRVIKIEKLIDQFCDEPGKMLQDVLVLIDDCRKQTDTQLREVGG